MPVKLITGATGDGKTHLAVKMIKDALTEGRPVFTNIKGINEDGFVPLEGVEPIPMNKDGELDWQLCPEADSELGIKGSLVVYDEAQKQKDNKNNRYFAWRGREKLSERAVVSELDEHRHRGYDIVFLTQEPNLLHLHLLGFVKEHYHCSRPMNKQCSQVALWRSWQSKPNSEAAVKRAEDVFEVHFDKNIFQHYKSTEMITDKKTRIPKYIKKLWMIGIGCFLLIIIYLIFGNSPFFKFSTYKAALGNKDAQKEVIEQNKLGQLQEKAKQQSTVNMNGITNSTAFDPAFECRKSENLNKSECVKWFDSLTKNKASVSAMNNPVYAVPTSAQSTVTYDPNKPFDDTDLKKNVSYTVVNSPKFSGCMKFKDGYRAYTEQGTILKVSQHDCSKLIKDAGNRPYDYFSVRDSQSSVSGLSSSVDSVSDSRVQDSKQVQRSSSVNIEHHPVFPEKDITKPSI